MRPRDRACGGAVLRRPALPWRAAGGSPAFVLAVILVLAASPAVRAQSTGKVTGVVRDAVRGETLPGVSVYLEENPYLGTITDADGRYFLLSVPPGTYTVVMS
ncbi:MAG: carboxypeptidase-like regulatory domain-containing protein, partial [Bacteroidetes bacterium]